MKKLYILLVILFSAILFLPNNIVLFAEEKLLTDYNTTNYSNFNIISETEFYCVNTSTNKIEYYNNGSMQEYSKEYGYNAGQFTNIVYFKKLNNGEFCILDNFNKLHFFDEDFNFIKSIQAISYNSSFTPLGNITQITTDIYSNVYLLDTTNNYILKASSTKTDFEVLNASYNLTNTQITILNNSNNVVLLTNNALINGQNQLQLQTSPNYIFSDALEYIYVVYNTEIIKYNSNLTQISSKTINSGSNYNINLESGIIYYIYNNEIQKIDNFASNTQNYEAPINVKENIKLSSQIVLVNPTTSVNLLKNPYSNNTLIKLSPTDTLIKLSATTNLTTNFAYVMIEKNNEYYLGYIEENLLSVANTTANEQIVIPTRNDIQTYKYPTKNLDINVKFDKLNNANTYTKTRTIILNNISYAELKIDNNYIYVLENEIISSQTNYINLYLQTNAKLCLYNGEKQIKLYNDANKSEVLFVLDKSQSVKILNHNQNLTEIEIIINNKIEKCYVETKYLTNQNNFIIPITLILTLISIAILIVLLFKFKRDKNYNI